MAGRKKKNTQENKESKTSKKRNALIYGIVFAVIGVFLVFVSIVPSGMGVVGRFIDEKLLGVIFGKASILAGLYCLCIGFVLIIFKKKIKFIAGLTCVFIPSLIIADALLTSKRTD